MNLHLLILRGKEKALSFNKIKIKVKEKQKIIDTNSSNENTKVARRTLAT